MTPICREADKKGRGMYSKEGFGKEPEKLAAAMKGDYFSEGNMGYKDEEGCSFFPLDILLHAGYV